MDTNALIDRIELTELKKRFPNLEVFENTMDVTRKTYDYWYEILVMRQDRRGEVVLVIEEPEGKILLHTKAFYPDGIYRLPTGGIHYDENVLAAIKRETHEETGLSVLLNDMLGIINIKFRYQEAILPFASYVVHLFCGTGEPKPIDPEENITGYHSVNIDEIAFVAKNLRSLAGRWRDWGNFRAIAHDLVAEKLSG